MFTNNNYYSAMDRFDDNLIEPLTPESVGEDVIEPLNLSTAELGTTTNPMANAILSVKERIMQGAGKLEFAFMGQNKGNSQQPTPETYGTVERQDLKELLSINDVKSSVHAAVHGQSLAGAGQRGFSGADRQAAIKEINRAIDFAGDVTNGGAIVFHLSEWQRPLVHAGQDRLKRTEGQWMFKGYDDENDETQMLVVDGRTGKFIEGIQKNQRVYEPKYVTAADEGLVGKKDSQGVVRKPDDWIDVDGNVIPKDADSQRMFDRRPLWDSEHTKFKVDEHDWQYFVKKASDWNRDHPDKKQMTPEEIYARTKLENNVLQAKGNSLFHGQNYDDYKKSYDKLKEALEYYEKYEKTVPESERWRLQEQVNEVIGGQGGKFVPLENKLPSDIIKDHMKSLNNHMRHIHESSAAADAQAIEYQKLIENLQSAEEYGLKKSAETIAKIGMTAYETTQRKKLKNPIYAAPENYDQRMYGSHPDEMRRVIEESRKEMAKKLLAEKRVHDMESAKKLAKDHIKGTLDIGHMNMWRQHFDPIDKDGNSIYKTHEERTKAFEKWMLKETEKLAKDGIVGHIHLTDNMGYDDEHLSPGQGNVPMKKFIENMSKHGVKDIIVEPGSFNAATALPDTMALVNSPIYGVRRGPIMAPRFGQLQHAHFGYNAPPFFTGGTYSPSEDWRPWTQIPLE